MTSANAARLGGDALRAFAHLPAYAVGAATADAMRESGFADVVVGTGDVDALARLIDPTARVLHLCGVHHRAFGRGAAVERLPVYATAAADALPPIAATALRNGGVVLLHSPRAATLFAELADAAALDRSAIPLVAISDAAAASAGIGWRAVHSVKSPTDAAMLASALDLCDKLRR